MKKFLITVLLVLMLFTAVSAGAVTIYYNDAYHEYDAEGITLKVNGNTVTGLHMPPLIINDRTMVPVREVFEALGATITWHDAECMSEVQYNGNSVKIKIGDRNTYVNGNAVPIAEDQPLPMLIGYIPEYMKSMVPVRFVAENLGLNVTWDGTTRTVSVSDEITGTFEPDEPEEEIPIEDVYGSFAGIEVDTDTRYDYIYIRTRYGISPSISRVANPDRIVLDFAGAKFVPKASEISLGGHCVSTVRYATHENMARVVLDLKASAQPMILSSEKGILIRVEKSENTQIIYDAFAKRVYFTENYSGSGAAVQNGYSMMFSGLKMKTQTIQIRDGYIYDIVIQALANGTRVIVDGSSKLTYSADKGFYKSDVQVQQPSVTPPADKPQTDIGKVDGSKTVVLDPGHGGPDPGAVGYNSAGNADAYESHINLDVAKKVQAKLETAGVKVIMTRTTDSYVSLQSRTDLENEKEPDCFVSIHCNSIAKPEINGTQVYYHPLSENGTILAENIYDAVVDITGLSPKRTQNGSHLYVIRKTDSPAALVEMAFISNESDRAYLKSDSGQDALATAIAQGIVKSLNEF